MQTTMTKPLIHRAEDMTPGQARYWNALAKKLEGRVDIIDPFREDMKTLRALYPKGTIVYRASTSGPYGRSAQIKTL